MKKKLLSNWGLKLVSLAFAFVLWLVVMSVTDPLETKVFSNVPVTLLNTQLLTDENKVYAVLDQTDVVRSVKVLVSNSLVNELKITDIVATADFKNLTATNTVQIEYSVPQYSNQIGSIEGSMSTVRLEIEDRASKSLNLRVNTGGQVAEDYELVSATAEQNRISISGAQSKVSAASYAAVEVDVSNITQDLATREKIYLYDAEGALLDEAPIEMNIQMVNVNVQVLPTKTVPIQYTVTGTPEDGYLETGEVECRPGKVKLVGSAYALNNVQKLVIPEAELDITGQTQDLVRSLNLGDFLPEDVKLAKDEPNSKVSIRVSIEPEQTRQLEIPAENVRIINVPSDYTAEIADEEDIYALEVKGLADLVSLLQASQIHPTVDVADWMDETERTGLSPGTHSIQAELDLGEGLIVSQPIQVQLTFSERE
ncbi:MAG: hypothetical protein LBQ15_10460 [Clostridium sp.]|jgi:YbbR domain-containing protein|nr:hypothetical protein [Clostridium sp.]